jgi:hypothetical protein
MPPYARVAHMMGPWVDLPVRYGGPWIQGPIVWATLAYGGISWFKCEHVFLYCKLGANCNACHKKWIRKNAIITLVVLAFHCWILIYFEISITELILFLFFLINNFQCNTFNGPLTTWNHEKFGLDNLGFQIFQDYWLIITTNFNVNYLGPKLPRYYGRENSWKI